MTGSSALTLAGVAVVGWALLTSIHVSIPDIADANRQSDAAVAVDDGSQGSGLTLEQIQAYATINLRRPLKDPPPVVVAPIPIQARLLGTIFEPSNPDQSQALFQLSDGSQRFFKAGQQFTEPGGVIVVKRVGDQSASVEYRDEQRDLTVGAP